MSHFETPKANLSLVKLKHTGTGGAQAQADSSIKDVNQDADGSNEVRRKLVMKKSSAQSIEMAGKLSSLKKYAEDQDNLNGIVGMIMSNSSKSIFGNEPIQESKGSIDRSLTFLKEDVHQDGDVFNLLEKDNEHYLSMERDVK